jgi:hypothetical protein
VERLIGTLRRECVDRMLVFGVAHLRQILSACAAYYNEVRTHLALGKDAPLGRAVQRSGAIVAIPMSCPDCATITSGHNFRKGQGNGTRTWLHYVDANRHRLSNLGSTAGREVEGCGWEEE